MTYSLSPELVRTPELLAPLSDNSRAGSFLPRVPQGSRWLKRPPIVKLKPFLGTYCLLHRLPYELQPQVLPDDGALPLSPVGELAGSEPGENLGIATGPALSALSICLAGADGV